MAGSWTKSVRVDVDPSLPRLVFVGPNLGRHPGWVVSQSEIVADLLRREGYPVRTTSSVRQPMLRFADMAMFLTVWRRRADLALISTFSGRAFYYADWIGRLCKALGLRHGLVLHGGGLPDMAADRGAWMRRVFGRADVLVAPSPFLARTAEALGFDARVIPNVLDIDDYAFRLRRTSCQPIRLLWVRTFHPIYHPQMAILTLAALRERGFDAELTMAGQDRGLEMECRRLASARGLEERVRFAGFLDLKAKQREFQSHDIYLHTNRVDNTPVTLIEAGAFGLPVVATDVGGVRDLLGDRGLLVPSERPDLAADAVSRLAGHGDEMERCSRAGRELAESCAWPRVFEAWRRLFADLHLIE